MQWFYAKGDQRVGPLSESEFQALFQNGSIGNETLVWRQGMSKWQTYAEATNASSANSPATSTMLAEETEVCAVSGKRFPKREMIEYQGKWISAEQRDVFFQRLREGVPPEGLRYAGFWIRFLAKVIDALILFSIGLVLNLAFGYSIMGQPKHPAANALAIFGVVFILRIALQLLYYWFFLNTYEATLGKLALGLKVVRSDGSRIHSARIIGRFFSEWVSSMILLIGYIIAAFDQEKRALHDHICDTRVIKTR